MKIPEKLEKYQFKDYVDLSRWLSYYEQIFTLVSLNPKNLLEIGLGSRVTYTLLKEIGFNITGFDNNRDLSPDILGDVINITDFFQNNQFDCVCCFQVLEHLPFNKLEPIIRSISKITSKYLVVSLPFAGYTFGFEFRVSRMRERKINFIFRIPRFWNRHVYDGIHHWEIGKKNYSLSKIESIFLKYYKLKERKFVRPNKTMIIFVLEKRE